MATEENTKAISPMKPGAHTTRKKSFFQRIGLLKSPNPRSDSVKRSWTRILDQKTLVLEDLNQSDVIRRNSHFFKGEEQFDVFNIKGPMGKGLCIEESGVHVAFCAGTGVLVFLDLVSHLLMRAYYKHYVEPKKVPESMT